MNPLAALIASLTGGQPAGGSGVQKDGAGSTGLFARLLGTAAQENGAQPQALLTHLQSLQTSARPGDATPARLAHQGGEQTLQFAEPGATTPETIVLDPSGIEPATGQEEQATASALLPQAIPEEAEEEKQPVLPLPGAGEGATAPDAQNAPTVNPEAAPQNTEPEAEAGARAPSQQKPEAPGLAHAQTQAAPQATHGLKTALSARNGVQPTPGGQPPAAAPDPDAAIRAAGQGNAENQPRTVLPPAPGQTLQPGRTSPPAKNQPDPAGQSAGDTGEASRPRPEITGLRTRPAPQPRQPQIQIRTIVNPVSGQSLLQVQERVDGDARPPGLLDAGMNIQLRAAGTAPSSPAQQPAQVPLNSLAVHIAQQAQNGNKRFDIRLDPPELGRIEVRLDVNREGRVTTHLVVERTETLDLLQRDSRSLERALQNAGLDTSEGGMKFSLKDHGHARHGPHEGGEGSGNGRNSDAGQDGENGPEDRELPLHPERRYVATQGLDIRI